MIVPVLKGVSSPELERPALPPDPADCAILLEAEIGPKEGRGADLFYFMVATPLFLQREEGARWGRGYLIVPRFSWEAIDRALGKLLLHAFRPTWQECAAELSKELHWEFEKYTPEA